MYTGMEWWTKVRLEVSRGEKSKREVLRDEGIHWETLKKISEASRAPWVSSEGASSQAKDWPLP